MATADLRPGTISLNCAALSVTVPADGNVTAIHHR
jgi:hypothetical protein